ncbi:MAG: hypothetical protein ACJAW3_000959 [Lentimonas sp.]|jgi:hypothetical protein
MFLKLKRKILDKIKVYKVFKNYHKVHYFESIENFGDLINKDIFESCLGYAVNVRPKYANFIMVGSLLQRLLTDNPKDRLKHKKYGTLNVFGSGFISEPSYEKEYFKRDVKFFGVRGRSSLERIANMGFDTKDVVLGDLGLIIDDFYKIRKNDAIYDVGIIPHYTDKELPIINEIRGKYKNIYVLDICQNPKDFINNLVKCKTIISSAMHGLIASDAYGIPNMRMKISDNIVGGDYKFRDYYSVFDIDPEYIVPKDFDKILDLQQHIKNKYKISKASLDQIKANLRKEIIQLQRFSSHAKILN